MLSAHCRNKEQISNRARSKLEERATGSLAIVIICVMGTKKGLTYMGLVVVMATITGMGFGHYWT